MFVVALCPDGHANATTNLIASFLPDAISDTVNSIALFDRTYKLQIFSDPILGVKTCLTIKL